MFVSPASTDNTSSDNSDSDENQHPQILLVPPQQSKPSKPTHQSPSSADPEQKSFTPPKTPKQKNTTKPKQNISTFNCVLCNLEFFDVKCFIKHINGHVLQKFHGVIDPSVPQSLDCAACPRCGCYFKSRGVSKHLASCTQKAIASSLPPDDPEDSDWLPPLHDVFSSHCPTVSYVPATHRQAWADVLSQELTRVANQNTVEAWTRLFMLPKCVLPASKRAGVRNRGDNFNITKLCQYWQSGHLKWLWSRSSRSHPSNSSSTSSPDSPQTLRSAIQHARHSRLGKACSVLASSGLAPNSPDTFQRLQQKHPIADSPPDMSDSVDSAAHPALRLASDFDLSRVLHSFTKGVGTDGTNFRVQHLLDVIDAHPAMPFLPALRSVLNLLLSGKAVDSVREFAAGARLTALAKGDSDVRPIAAGNIFRRLASKCVCALITTRSQLYFKGLQYGVSFSGGAEHIIHSVRDVISDKWESDEDLMMLKVDFSNAFNSISRSAMLSEVVREFPDLLPWVQWCYGSSSQLFHHGKSILSCVGVQQGDPLGPFLFCLVEHVLLKPMKQRWPRLRLNKWYADDGVIIGSTSEIISIIEYLRTQGAPLGLFLNLNKCELYSPSVDNFDSQFSDRSLGQLSIPPELHARFSVPDFTLLGAPFGSAVFCQKAVAKMRESNQQLLDRLALLEDIQVSLHLLRTCISYCKFVYLIRTTPPSLIQPELDQVDLQIRSSLDRFADLHMTDVAWSQAQLSLSRGGLGLRSVSRHARAAYVSSHCRFMPGLDNDYIRECLSGLGHELAPAMSADEYADSILSLEKPPSQKSFSAKLDDRDKDSLRKKLSASTCDSIRMLSVTAVRSSAWLQAMPCRGPFDMVLESDEMQVALQHRLGLPLISSVPMCPACRKVPLDPLGHHHLTCKNQGHVVRRHNRIRDALFDLLKLAELNPEKEQGASWADRSRPADVLCDWSLSKKAAFDISVVSPLTDENLKQAGEFDVIERAAALKHSENDSQCLGLKWLCVPLVVDSYGQWCAEAHEAFSKISDSLHIKLKVSPSSSLSFIFCTLGLVLARQNALSILSRYVKPLPVGRREVNQLHSRVD
jgi:hypothetical protein